jgi:hypothetical protein
MKPDRRLKLPLRPVLAYATILGRRHGTAPI